MKQKKKLSLVILDLDDIKNPLLAAGQAHATYEVASRLAKKGHTVTVISSAYPGAKDRVQSGITYRHIGIPTGNIKLNNMLYILFLPFTVRKIQADVILECFTAPISTLFSPLFTKIPVVGLSTSFEADRFSTLYHIPFWIFEKYGCTLYRYFIALTPFLNEKMKKYNPSITSCIIGQGVSEKYFSVKQTKPLYILFLGRLDMHQKGLDLLFEAYARVAKTISYPLVIAGLGADRQILQKRAETLGIAKQVTFVGFADEKKKLQLFSKAAFVVLPSRNEGFPLVALEAIASGKRIVSFKIPSLYWATKHVSRKVTPFHAQQYAQALLLESRNTNDQTAKKCRDFARVYSWDNVTSQFESFFYEIAQKEVQK